jgi:hypothetical protein
MLTLLFHHDTDSPTADEVIATNVNGESTFCFARNEPFINQKVLGTESTKDKKDSGPMSDLLLGFVEEFENDMITDNSTSLPQANVNLPQSLQR